MAGGNEKRKKHQENDPNKKQCPKDTRTIEQKIDDYLRKVIEAVVPLSNVNVEREEKYSMLRRLIKLRNKTLRSKRLQNTDDKQPATRKVRNYRLDTDQCRIVIGRIVNNRPLMDTMMEILEKKKRYWADFQKVVLTVLAFVTNPISGTPAAVVNYVGSTNAVRLLLRFVRTSVDRYTPISLYHTLCCLSNLATGWAITEVALAVDIVKEVAPVLSDPDTAGDADLVYLAINTLAMLTQSFEDCTELTQAIVPFLHPLFHRVCSFPRTPDHDRVGQAIRHQAAVLLRTMFRWSETSFMLVYFWFVPHFARLLHSHTTDHVQLGLQLLANFVDAKTESAWAAAALLNARLLNCVEATEPAVVRLICDLLTRLRVDALPPVLVRRRIVPFLRFHRDRNHPAAQNAVRWACEHFDEHMQQATDEEEDEQ